MKKALFFCLALTIVISLSACSENGSKGEDNLTIGISTPEPDHGWMGEFVDRAEKKAKEIKESEGIDYLLSSADDPNKQANDVDDLISQGVDVIVMEPIESEALTPVGQKVKDAGIPLVTVDRELDNDAATAVVKGDNEGIGINAGEYFLEHIEGKAKVVEIEGSPSSVTKQRGGGFKEAMENESDIEMVATAEGDFTKNAALDAMQDVLQAHSEIDAVFTQDDEMAEGVLQAIQEAGREDEIQFMTGAGGKKDVFEIIQDDGLIKATFLYPPHMIDDGLDIAVDLAKGNEPEETSIVKEAIEITKDNVEEYYDPDSKY